MKGGNTANILKYVFVAIAVAELSGHAFGWGVLGKFTKPLIVPVLLLWFRKGMKVPVNLSFIFAVFALLFSWFGDVAFMYAYRGEWYFLLGLAAFAVAQPLYFFSFKHAKGPGDWDDPPLSKHLLNVFPFAVFVIGFLWVLWPGLGGLKLPATVYASLIVMMALGAVYRNGRTNTKSFNQVSFGAILFVLSDSLLAIDKFCAPMVHAPVWVMGTYILAQWNIINGLQEHYNFQP